MIVDTENRGSCGRIRAEREKERSRVECLLSRLVHRSSLDVAGAGRYLVYRYCPRLSTCTLV